MKQSPTLCGRCGKALPDKCECKPLATSETTPTKRRDPATMDQGELIGELVVHILRLLMRR
jgi:hypothetical protein